jgi:hypothetical protein
MRRRKNELPYVELAIPYEQYLSEVEKEIEIMPEKALNSQGDKKAALIRITRKAAQNVFSNWFVVEGEIKIKQFPLGSLAASGKAEIPGAGVKVYVQGNEKHIPYARRWVCPPNPRTPIQQANRELFKKAMQAWQVLSIEAKTQWKLKAQSTGSLTGHNLFIRDYMKRGSENNKF